MCGRSLGEGIFVQALQTFAGNLSEKRMKGTNFDPCDQADQAFH
jgi:hypothetical protein